MLPYFGEIEEAIDAAKQVVRRDMIFEIEGVEQPLLVAALLTHHAQGPRSSSYWIRLAQVASVPGFFNRIGRDESFESWKHDRRLSGR
jgi:hypothetical protein